jgi:hypothetical protein
VIFGIDPSTTSDLITAIAYDFELREVVDESTILALDAVGSLGQDLNILAWYAGNYLIE